MAVEVEEGRGRRGGLLEGRRKFPKMEERCLEF